MIGLPKFEKEYFQKFGTKRVAIKPYDPKSKIVAEKYIKKLTKLLEGFDVEIIHRGSTALKISGKGDVELGVYPTEGSWFQVLERLVNYYKGIGCFEKNYARFNDKLGGFEIEVIMMKGHEATVDKKLTKYLLANPEILKRYEKLKGKYSFSKREYQIQKDKFLRRMMSKIPDD
jgi:GrpB-like predicted nucleotidyltransferase (UPF0157 family)